MLRLKNASSLLFSCICFCILVLLSKFEDDLFCNFQVHLQSNERMRFSECWESQNTISSLHQTHIPADGIVLNLISFVISLRHSQSCRDLWQRICTCICNSLSLHTAQIWHDRPSCETMEDNMVQPIDYPSCLLTFLSRKIERWIMFHVAKKFY